MATTLDWLKPVGSVGAGHRLEAYASTLLLGNAGLTWRISNHEKCCELSASGRVMPQALRLSSLAFAAQLTLALALTTSSSAAFSTNRPLLDSVTAHHVTEARDQ